MELRVEYPKPVDKPQVGETQETKGTWKYDGASWFTGWKFTKAKSTNMKVSCIGLLIDPENDERFVGKSRDAWFIRRREIICCGLSAPFLHGMITLFPHSAVMGTLLGLIAYT